ncbi:MAG: tetratricopeptide repeat protein [Chloracidobacterium sp.]|nr:tetratricopeptide repeat protein [Chloracidobacterium sp.]
MKRCPKCGREYDLSMSFCLDDGSELLYGPGSGSPRTPEGVAAASVDEVVGHEPQTAILHSTDARGEAATRAQIHTTAAEPQSNLSEPSEKPSRITDRAVKPLLVVAAIAVVILGGFLGYRYFSSPNSKQIESIAVMPFVNESKNADAEYLSDGMTETLIKSLSILPEMDVKPRSAVFRYKGKDTDITTIGKELNVQAVLTGRVTERGDQLTLSLELVDVERNRVIWTEQYQRRQADLVSLQSEIAKDVSAKLMPRLSGADETKVSKQATTDPAAYQAYLRGRFLWNRRTGESLDKAIEQFQAAIERDPNYALAIAGLADVYSIYRDYSVNAPADSMSRAEAYAKSAISIDGQLAEPHGTLGNVYYNRFQWAESESEYKRAIELNPNYPTAYHWYAVLLFSLGRNDEAEAAIMRAHQLDPMSSIISQNVAQAYRMKGDHKAAIETCQRIIDLDPNFPGCHFAIAWSYLKTGRNNEAIAEFQKAVELNGRYSTSLAELAVALAVSGRSAETKALLKELEEQHAKKQANGSDIATVYAALGNKDKAFEWLEKDVSARNPRLAEFRWSPASEPLRDDPRFVGLLRRMGLPE